MNFYLRLDKQARPASLPVIRHPEVSRPESGPESALFIYGEDEHTTFEAIHFPTGSAWIIGDPVYHAKRKEGAYAFLESGDFGRFFRAVDGFFFLLWWSRKSRRLVAGSSMFNILPVFYAESSQALLLSSSFDLLKGTGEVLFSDDPRYYLEKALFYYPLFSRTPLKQIKSIPSNHVLVYDGSLSFSRHTDLSDYYTSSPAPWRKSLDGLSELFIEQAKDFIPQEKFCATLTGGFDGRAVVSLAFSLNRPFYTYSYGAGASPDLEVPMAISREFGFRHQPLILDEQYSRRHFWKNGLAFLSGSYGLGNMSRAHYFHALQTVLRESRFLLSGNFGSEMLRSMKVPGVMASEMLFKLFEAPGKRSLRSSMEGWPGLRYLSGTIAEKYMEPLLDEISRYLNNLPRNLSTNKKFCIYLFEEVFPKYFGPEITVQRRFLNHRAPFLCFRFIEALLKTGIAGANSNFRETNPFRRYHGQALYAQILKRTTPGLLDVSLDRGYKPRHFLTPLGPLQIAAGFSRAKLLVRKAAAIPDYSKDNTAHNLEEWRKTPIASELFDPGYFEHQFAGNWIKDQVNFANMISAVKYHNLVNQPHQICY